MLHERGQKRGSLSLSRPVGRGHRGSFGGEGADLRAGCVVPPGSSVAGAPARSRDPARSRFAQKVRAAPGDGAKSGVSLSPNKSKEPRCCFSHQTSFVATARCQSPQCKGSVVEGERAFDMSPTTLGETKPHIFVCVLALRRFCLLHLGDFLHSPDRVN
jgi:hypothetical protein